VEDGHETQYKDYIIAKYKVNEINQNIEKINKTIQSIS
jgi:hypothetical protein